MKTTGYYENLSRYHRKVSGYYEKPPGYHGNTPRTAVTEHLGRRGTLPAAELPRLDLILPRPDISQALTKQERNIETGTEVSKTGQSAYQVPPLDINRIADQVSQVIERKIRIERERRGK